MNRGKQEWMLTASLTVRQHRHLSANRRTRPGNRFAHSRLHRYRTALLTQRQRHRLQPHQHQGKNDAPHDRRSRPPQVAYPIENPAWAEHVSTHSDQVWGRQNFRALEWDARQDQLWIVSGDERLVNKVDMQDASWQFLRLDTQTERARPPLQTAFNQNHIIGVWAGWPQQLMLFNMKAENNDTSRDKSEAQYSPKPARTLTLPEGFTVRRVEW